MVAGRLREHVVDVWSVGGYSRCAVAKVPQVRYIVSCTVTQPSLLHIAVRFLAASQQQLADHSGRSEASKITQSDISQYLSKMQDESSASMLTEFEFWRQRMTSWPHCSGYSRSSSVIAICGKNLFCVRTVDK